MRPRLVSLFGPLSGEITVSGAEFTIGRDPANACHLDDPAVSSRHCVIVGDGDRFVLRDCDSTNGTFINGKAASCADLNHGDEIQIGHARFRFLLNDDVVAPAPAVTIQEDHEEVGLMSTETIQLDPQNSAFLRTQLGLEDPAALQRRTRDMSVLLRLNAEIHDIADTESLQNVLLKRIFETIPAENGVFLLGNSVDQLVSGATLLRKQGQPLYVSRTILQETMMSGRAVLRNDLLAAGEVSESLRKAGLRSVLCVPLTVMNVPTGVLYLSTTNPATPFDQQHLEMVVAIAGIGCSCARARALRGLA